MEENMIKQKSIGIKPCYKKLTNNWLNKKKKENKELKKLRNIWKRKKKLCQKNSKNNIILLSKN